MVIKVIPTTLEYSAQLTIGAWLGDFVTAGDRRGIGYQTGYQDGRDNRFFEDRPRLSKLLPGELFGRQRLT